MGRIVFYEKPGCRNNTRQKRLLQEAGARLDVRNLLTESWSTARLAGFFQQQPVADWFNKSAPAITSGIINPSAMNAEAALAAMIADPLLIRRPLIEYGNYRCSGFDWPTLANHLDLTVPSSHEPQDLETCTRQHLDHPACPTPETAQ